MYQWIKKILEPASTGKVRVTVRVTNTPRYLVKKVRVRRTMVQKQKGPKPDQTDE